MIPDVLDYNLEAARAARQHLERMQDALRAKCVATWLLENRQHPKAKEVDDFLTHHRRTGSLETLFAAEIVIERYSL